MCAIKIKRTVTHALTLIDVVQCACSDPIFLVLPSEVDLVMNCSFKSHSLSIICITKYMSFTFEFLYFVSSNSFMEV